jgi:hypothetical protein
MMSQPQVVQLDKGRAYQDISSAIAAKYNCPVDVLYQLLGHVAAYTCSVVVSSSFLSYRSPTVYIHQAL